MLFLVSPDKLDSRRHKHGILYLFSCNLFQEKTSKKDMKKKQPKVKMMKVRQELFLYSLTGTIFVQFDWNYFLYSLTGTIFCTV